MTAVSTRRLEDTAVRIEWLELANRSAAYMSIAHLNNLNIVSNAYRHPNG